MPVKRKKSPAKPKKRAVNKRKVAKKKSVARRPAPKSAKKKAKETIVGRVTHYFAKVRAAVIKLKAPLKVGDEVKVKGHTTDFSQKITSMQVDHVVVNSAKKGQEIGLLVDSRVREHDIVYKI